MIKLIALDIDGTLVPDGQNRVPRENIEAIAQARRAGIHIILATARKCRPARFVARQLGIELPLICHSGAYVVDSAGRVISHTPLSHEAAHDVVRFADDAGHRLVVTIDERNYLSQRYCPLTDAPFEDLVIVNKAGDALAGHPTRIATVDEAGSCAIYERFRDDPRVGIHRFYRDGTLYFLSVFNPRISKGAALLATCRHLGIAPAETLAIGDAESDISMFAVAGRGIAMPHSPQDVKSAATMVAPEDETAVAWAIRHILNESLAGVG